MKPAAKILTYEPDPNKFDLVTHRWNGQGQLVHKNPYRTYIMDGRQYFERPVNSGNLWFENNQPAGRVELTFNDKGHVATKKFAFDAEHVAYEAPLTGADKVHYELEQARSNNAALEAELAAIKSDFVKLQEVREGIPATPTVAGSTFTETVKASEPKLSKRS